MRYVLQLSILLAALDVSTVLAADRLQVAQAVQGQIPVPGQVQPAPLLPTPLISPQTSTGCVVSCDTQVMTCQNACIVAGPTTSTVKSGSSACSLNCTTQQLLCKQACSMTPIGGTP